MNFKQRKTIADALRGIAERHGASVDISNDPKWHDTRFAATFPWVSVSCTVGSPGGPMLNWHGAFRRLRPEVFAPGSVNTHHGCKATTCADTWAALFAEFTRLAAAVADKSAFIPE